MLTNKDSLRKIIYTAKELFKSDRDQNVVEILDVAAVSVIQTRYDNWNGGMYFYTMYIQIPLELFSRMKSTLPAIEKKIEEKITVLIRPDESIGLDKVMISPVIEERIEWAKVADVTTKEKIIQDIDLLKSTMISVATGGQKIQGVNGQYMEVYTRVKNALGLLKIDNPNPYSDLWNWYGKWSSGEMPSYNDRRVFIGNMYNPLIEKLKISDQSGDLEVLVDLDGWERISRSIGEIKKRLDSASNEEQFQAIGLLCRDTLISLGQEVFDKQKHPSPDGVEISKTDAKRMLDAYVVVELAGKSSEAARKYVKGTIDFANELTHKRSATKKDALIVSTATISLINIFGILEER